MDSPTNKRRTVRIEELGQSAIEETFEGTFKGPHGHRQRPQALAVGQINVGRDVDISHVIRRAQTIGGGVLYFFRTRKARIGLVLEGAIRIEFQRPVLGPLGQSIGEGYRISCLTQRLGHIRA